MPVSQSAFCWPKFVLGRELPGHNHAPIWLTLVLLVGRRIKALSGKVFSLAVNAESPRKFLPLRFSSRFREKSAWSVTSWRRPQSTSVFCCGPYCPQDPGNFSGSQRAPPALPTPRSRSPNPRGSHIPGATRSFSSVLLLPNLCCRVVWLSPFSLTAMCPNRILPFRLHLDPCSQRPCLRKGPYVPSAFPRRWSVDRPCKAEPGCPASLLGD